METAARLRRTVETPESPFRRLETTEQLDAALLIWNNSALTYIQQRSVYIVGGSYLKRGSNLFRAAKSFLSVEYVAEFEGALMI